MSLRIFVDHVFSPSIKWTMALFCMKKNLRVTGQTFLIGTSVWGRSSYKIICSISQLPIASLVWKPKIRFWTIALILKHAPWDLSFSSAGYCNTPISFQVWQEYNSTSRCRSMLSPHATSSSRRFCGVWCTMSWSASHRWRRCCLGAVLWLRWCQS
jgi:hypothetical protein